MRTEPFTEFTPKKKPKKEVDCVWKHGAAAPVTGAAADEHNLNVVDCDASVTVPCQYSVIVHPR